MAILPRAGAVRHAGKPVCPPLRPGQYLLVRPVPAASAARIRLHRPTYGPPASHLSLLSGGLQLRSRSPAWTDRAATRETSSAAGASGAPGRTCHLRLGHLETVVQVGAGAVPHAATQLAADGTGIAVVP